MIDYNKYSVDQLVREIQRDSVDAFKYIFDQYWHILIRHSRRYLIDDEQAQDVVQEVLTSLWENRGNLELSLNLSSYLYRATRNKIIDKIRQSKMYDYHLQNLRSTTANFIDATDHLARERKLALLIEEEIQYLPNAVQQIFRLRREEHMSTKEVSQFLGISESTVKNQMNKAIKLLKTQLGKSLFIL